MSPTFTRRSALTAAAATTLGLTVPTLASVETAAADDTSTPEARGTASGPGRVYVLGNEADGNRVHVFGRDAEGALTAAGSVGTRGDGAGDGLGSQDSLLLDEAGHYLYAVNAGSNSVTSFAVTDTGLRWLGVVPSGGDVPISVSVRGERAYVLNAGGDGNVSGFSVRRGRLRPLAGSTWPLSGTDTDPAQVSITPSGRQLVVTEKETQLISVYALDDRGVPTARTSILASGVTPFGFTFTPGGQLVVSEAGPSAASTYELFPYGLRTITASLANTQAAACWVVVTDDGRHAYTGNGGGSLVVSGYGLNRSGELSLLDEDGRTGVTEGNVGDLALSVDSRFLYARLDDGRVAGFRLGRDGSLTALELTPGIPDSAAGIVAR